MMNVFSYGRFSRRFFFELCMIHSRVPIDASNYHALTFLFVTSVKTDSSYLDLDASIFCSLCFPL